MTGAGDTGAGFSQHPADVLIRELICTRRATMPEEIAWIVERMATAPFEPRLRKVCVAERGMAYQGRTVRAREDSLFYHLTKRVVEDEQWIPGTTAEEYLADLRQAIRVPEAQLIVYAERGGAIAATVAPTAVIVPTARQGSRALPNFLVVYSADRGNLVTSYQFFTLDEARVPREALWLG